MPIKGKEATAWIDNYLAGLPEDKRIVLSDLRRTILKAAPEAEEIITYAMPGIGKDGPLVAYMAFKNHFSLFPMGSPLTTMADEISPWRTSKGTLQFTADKLMQPELVTRIVKARLAENAQKAASRKSRRKRTDR